MGKPAEAAVRGVGVTLIRWTPAKEADEVDADHTKWNVESVNSVLSRTTQLVMDIENKLQKEKEDNRWTCILVAHGDVLQILQTGFNKIDGTQHRTLPHL